jgi:hypothetical protein
LASTWGSSWGSSWASSWEHVGARASRVDGGFPHLFKPTTAFRRPILLDLDINSKVRLFVRVRTRFSKRRADVSRKLLPRVAVASRQNLHRSASTRAQVEVFADAKTNIGVSHWSRAGFDVSTKSIRHVTRVETPHATRLYFGAVNRSSASQILRSKTKVFGGVRSQVEQVVRGQYAGKVSLAFRSRSQASFSSLASRIEEADRRDIELIRLLVER